MAQDRTRAPGYHRRASNGSPPMTKPCSGRFTGTPGPDRHAGWLVRPLRETGAWFAQTFAGLTWQRFGIYCLIVAAVALSKPSARIALLHWEGLGALATGLLTPLVIVLVARLASGKCHVVFVTAYDKYAVAAFEQGAVDYVVKPFSTARLAETVARLKDRLRERPANLDGILNLLANRARDGKEYLRWVTASQGSTTSFITVEQICYFRADNKYTMVITPDREAVIRRPIKELAEAVDPGIFWQIHRSTLVNIHAIAGVTRDFRGHLSVKLKQRKETLPVSESYAHLFRQM